MSDRSPLPKTLTLIRSGDGYQADGIYGFDEGMFDVGNGFDKPVAEEIKRRYDSHVELVAAVSELSEWIRAALECPQWCWDHDQHEAATSSFTDARALLTRIKGEKK